ncbi:hypothetical protein HPP92_015346 [Vanilla planifolia]|uniref:Uncharacterized protein n=1 Tax=Vanilla planifolia TaxID=51239 RepID=A0A835UX45_VANPL|nr:hypothetical protein HPP92_015346 [Vanilla planifolia]
MQKYRREQVTAPRPSSVFLIFPAWTHMAGEKMARNLLSSPASSQSSSFCIPLSIISPPLPSPTLPLSSKPNLYGDALLLLRRRSPSGPGEEARELQLWPVRPPEEGPRMSLLLSCSRPRAPAFRPPPPSRALLRRGGCGDSAALCAGLGVGGRGGGGGGGGVRRRSGGADDMFGDGSETADTKGADGAAMVCRGWRECVRRIWISADEIRIRVSQIRFVGSVFQRCSGLSRLSLIMESDADSTVLACVAFSCPNLECLEISLAKNAVNRITGDELGRFVAEKRSLSVLKVEGCNNLGFLNLSSCSLSTLWLSDLSSISKTAAYCPNLKELSLDFAQQRNDSTDLVSMMDSLGCGCPSLRNIHIASTRLCNDVVRALADANFRGLRMLSLVLGSRVTDASVAAIISCYTNLELLDLSGSSISDNGVGMICNAFARTLSRLLLALCPNITSSDHLEVLNEFSSVENQFSLKRSADGSKRVHVPRFLSQAPCEDEKGKKMRPRPCIVHLN